MIAGIVGILLCVLIAVTLDRANLMSRQATVTVVYLAGTMVTFVLGAIWADDYPITLVGVLWITLSYGFVVVGYNFGPVPQPDASRPRHSHFNLRLIQLIIIVCCVASAVHLSFVAGTIVETLPTFELGETQKVVSDTIADHYRQYEEGEALDRSWYHGLVAFSFCGAMLAGFSVGVFGWAHRNALYTAIALVVPMITSFATGTRTSVLYATLYFAASFLSGRFFVLLKNETVLTVKRISMVAGFGLFLIGIALFIRVFRSEVFTEIGGLSLLEQFNQVFLYSSHQVLADLSNFAVWLDEFWDPDEPLRWGTRLLRGPAGLWAGLEGRTVPRGYEIWIVGPGMALNNMFTMHRGFIEDFGLLSIFLYAVLGWLARYAEAQMAKGNAQWACAHIFCLATFMYAGFEPAFAQTVQLVALAMVWVILWLAVTRETVAHESMATSRAIAGGAHAASGRDPSG